MMSHGHRDIFAQKTGADGEKAVPTTWARRGGGLLTHKPSQGIFFTLNDEKRSKENLIKSKVLTTSHIRNWIRNGALEELEMVVLEGQVSL